MKEVILTHMKRTLYFARNLGSSASLSAKQAIDLFKNSASAVGKVWKSTDEKSKDRLFGFAQQAFAAGLGVLGTYLFNRSNYIKKAEASQNKIDGLESRAVESAAYDKHLLQRNDNLIDELRQAYIKINEYKKAYDDSYCFWRKPIERSGFISEDQEAKIDSNRPRPDK